MATKTFRVPPNKPLPLFLFFLVVVSIGVILFGPYTIYEIQPYIISIFLTICLTLLIHSDILSPELSINDTNVSYSDSIFSRMYPKSKTVISIGELKSIRLESPWKSKELWASASARLLFEGTHSTFYVFPKVFPNQVLSEVISDLKHKNPHIILDQFAENLGAGELNKAEKSRADFNASISKKVVLYSIAFVIFLLFLAFVVDLLLKYIFARTT